MTSKGFKNREQQIDPGVERELRLIDALAAGDAIIPAEDEALRTVVTELRAARPRPTEDFVRSLDASVERGFDGDEALSARRQAGAGGSRRVGQHRFGRQQWLALGSACAVLLVVAGGTLTLNQQQSQQGDDSLVTGTVAPDQDGRAAVPMTEERPSAGNFAAGEAQSDSKDAYTPPSESLSAKAPARKQVRTARLELAAPTAELEDSADKVVATIDRYGGYVQDSSVTGGDGGQSGATFSLRIPTEKFNAALADLSEIAHVRSRTQNTQDVTSTYDRTRAALADARAQRAGLRKALAKAETEQQIDSIRLRLRGVNQRIDRLDAQLGRLNQRIEFVDLDMTILATTADPDGSWGLGDAVDDAWSVLRTIAGVLIVGLAILAPFMLIAALAAVAWRHRRRRSRERVIDTRAPAGEA
jgi:hypothetical protein